MFLFMVLSLYLFDAKAESPAKNSGAKTEHSDEKDHGDEEAEESASVGPGKAVLRAKNEGRFLLLAPEAQKTIGLKVAEVAFVSGQGTVPIESLLEYQQVKAVYRLLPDGFIEYVVVNIKKRTDGGALIVGPLSSGDKIVVSGVAFLRSAQLEASGEGGAGHAD